MKERKGLVKNVILLLIMILLIVITFCIIFRNQDISQIGRIISDTNKFYIALAVLSMVLYFFCAGYAIKIPIDKMGYKMPYRNCFKYALVEFYFSGITPSNTGGQPMVAVAMKNDKYKFADTVMVLMAVTALYKTGILVMIFAFMLFSFDYIIYIAGDIRYLMYLGASINAVFIALLALLMFSNKVFWIIEKVFYKLIIKLSFIKNPEKIRDRIIDQKIKYGQCAFFFKQNPFVIFRMFVVLFLQRFLLLVITYFVYKAFGLRETSLYQIVAIQLVLSLSVEMMPLPGAVGISESVFIMLYKLIFGNVLMYPALLLIRGINFYLPFVISGIFVFVIFAKKTVLKGD